MGGGIGRQIFFLVMFYFIFLLLMSYVCDDAAQHVKARTSDAKTFSSLPHDDNPQSSGHPKSSPHLVRVIDDRLLLGRSVIGPSHRSAFLDIWDVRRGQGQVNTDTCKLGTGGKRATWG